jgi:hypothetical protein
MNELTIKQASEIFKIPAKNVEAAAKKEGWLSIETGAEKHYIFSTLPAHRQIEIGNMLALAKQTPALQKEQKEKALLKGVLLQHSEIDDLAPELSAPEKQRLTELEGIIEENMKAFIQVGMALKEIKDKRLYRQQYNNFKLYVKNEWDITGTHAYRLIDAATVVDVLKSVPWDTSDNEKCTMVHFLPANERQIRPLIGLPIEFQQKAWQEAVQLSQTDGIPVTARLVARCVELYWKLKRGEEPDPVAETNEKLKKLTLEGKRADRKVSDAFSKGYALLFKAISESRSFNWQNSNKKLERDYLIALNQMYKN